MSKYAKPGRRILIAVGILLAANLFAVLAFGDWEEAGDWGITQACPTLCTPAQQILLDHAPGLKEATESITKSAKPSADEREKHRQRNIYRARNLIGWT